MTDCFQDIELEKRITYKTIEMLNNKKIHYLIVTKSKNVTNNEYLSIYDKKLSHFQISVTSTSNEISNKYENASTPYERINSIEKLSEMDFDVSIRLSPFIEGFIDYSILNKIKCEKILIEFLKVNHFVKSNFDIDYSEYKLKYGGYQHLELSKKLEMIRNITGFKQLSVGEYVKDHHEYFKNNVNYNKNDCCNLNIYLMNFEQKTIF